MNSWTTRAERRGAGVVLFTPPSAYISERIWHLLDTHLGRRRMQWRPGIYVWHDETGQRWTAETAGAARWVWVQIAHNQAGGQP